MRGYENIADILRNEYGLDPERYDDIDYEIQQFTDEISRVKITSKKGSWSPVYAMFDGFHVCFYGDYGEFVFDCTWKTSVDNLAYNSPYYQLEKVRPFEASSVYDEEEAVKDIIKLLHENYWYEILDDAEKEELDKYILDDWACISEYKALDEGILEEDARCLHDIIAAAKDSEFELYKTVYDLCSDSFDCNSVLGVEDYELCGVGKKAPVRYFIILYMLSVVAKDRENNKSN